MHRRLFYLKMLDLGAQIVVPPFVSFFLSLMMLPMRVPIDVLLHSASLPGNMLIAMCFVAVCIQAISAIMNRILLPRAYWSQFRVRYGYCLLGGLILSIVSYNIGIFHPYSSDIADLTIGLEKIVVVVLTVFYFVITISELRKAAISKST